MFPAVIPIADVIYRSFYDEQDYRLRMQELAGYGEIPKDAALMPSPRAPRLAGLTKRIRSAAVAVSAVFSLQSEPV